MKWNKLLYAFAFGLGTLHRAREVDIDHGGILLGQPQPGRFTWAVLCLAYGVDMLKFALFQSPIWFCDLIDVCFVLGSSAECHRQNLLGFLSILKYASLMQAQFYLKRPDNE